MDSPLAFAHAQLRLTDCLHDFNEREIAFWERGSTASRLGALLCGAVRARLDRVTALKGSYLMAIKAEYIWIDGTEPTAKLRSKTKILARRRKSLPIWGFDGSSTNQAEGHSSDCVLQAGLHVPGPDPRRRRRSSSCARSSTPT